MSIYFILPLLILLVISAFERYGVSFASVSILLAAVIYSVFGFLDLPRQD